MDHLYFYTTTDNELGTLRRILKATRISELRRKLADDYFEYCLVSYLAREDVSTLQRLSDGESVMIDAETTMQTQDYYWFYSAGRMLSSNATIASAGEQTKTPDVVIETKGGKIIIDAYNGTSEKAILKKIRVYRSAFPNAEVYVFCSLVATLEQIVQSRTQFKFFTADAAGAAVVECQTIAVTHDWSISAADVNDTYVDEYCTFRAELQYWLYCEVCRKIVQTADGNKCDSPLRSRSDSPLVSPTA